MAIVYAIKNGNWSDGSTWNTGVVPTAADDVYLNSYTVNMQYDNVYYAKTISNYENLEYSIVRGGKLNESTESNYTKIIYIVSDIKADGNIVSFKNRINIVGNIEGKSLSTAATESILYTVNYNSYHSITGNVKLLDGNVAQLIGNANSAQYTSFTIDGNIEIYGGCLYRNGAYTSTGAIYINGDIILDGANSKIASSTIQTNDSTVVNGNITISNTANLGSCGNAVFNGTITTDEVSVVAANLGNAIFNGEVHSYFARSGYVSVLANGCSNPVFNEGFYLHNGDAITGACIIGAQVRGNNYSISFKKHFDVGAALSFGMYNTQSPYFPIGTINALGVNAEFHYNNKFNFLYAENWNIEDKQTFKIINDNQDPLFVTTTLVGLNYPSENDVKNNVEYGMQNEYRGRYTPTVLTDEQLQRIANCATMQEVAELSIVIANKYNEE